MPIRLATVLLRRWRDRARLNGVQAASRLELVQSMYWDVEHGRKKPGIDSAFSIERLTDGDVPAWAWTVEIADERLATRAFAREKLRRAA